MDYTILKQYIKDSDMTCKELAISLDCSPGYLNHIVNGKYTPGPTLRRKLKSLLMKYNAQDNQEKQAHEYSKIKTTNESKPSVYFKTIE